MDWPKQPTEDGDVIDMAVNACDYHWGPFCHSWACTGIKWPAACIKYKDPVQKTGFKRRFDDSAECYSGKRERSWPDKGCENLTLTTTGAVQTYAIIKPKQWQKLVESGIQPEKANVKVDPRVLDQWGSKGKGIVCFSPNRPWLEFEVRTQEVRLVREHILKPEATYRADQADDAHRWELAQLRKSLPKALKGYKAPPTIDAVVNAGKTFGLASGTDHDGRLMNDLFKDTASSSGGNAQSRGLGRRQPSFADDGDDEEDPDGDEEEAEEDEEEQDEDFAALDADAADCDSDYEEARPRQAKEGKKKAEGTKLPESNQLAICGGPGGRQLRKQLSMVKEEEESQGSERGRGTSGVADHAGGILVAKYFGEGSVTDAAPAAGSRRRRISGGPKMIEEKPSSASKPIKSDQSSGGLFPDMNGPHGSEPGNGPRRNKITDFPPWLDEGLKVADGDDGEKIRAKELAASCCPYLTLVGEVSLGDRLYAGRRFKSSNEAACLIVSKRVVVCEAAIPCVIENLPRLEASDRVEKLKNLHEQKSKNRFPYPAAWCRVVLELHCKSVKNGRAAPRLVIPWDRTTGSDKEKYHPLQPRNGEIKHVTIEKKCNWGRELLLDHIVVPQLKLGSHDDAIKFLDECGEAMNEELEDIDNP